MKTITVAFDIDGTLRNNTHKEVVANERIRTLLVTLASFKNTKILVWSGGGELYARQVVAAFGLEKYVDSYAGKTLVNCRNPLSGCEKFNEDHWHHILDGLPQPDIAIDDIQTFELGAVNLIVREK